MKPQRKSTKRKGLESERKSSAREVADELDLSVETIREYAIAGCPHTKGGGTRPNLFSAAEVAAWMKANGRTGKVGVRADEITSPDLAAAKLRKENALASKYELQVSRERKQLVPLAAIQQWLVQNLSGARNKLLGLAARVTPLLEGRDAAERQSIIEDAIRESLEDVSKSAGSLADRLEAA